MVFLSYRNASVLCLALSLGCGTDRDQTVPKAVDPDQQEIKPMLVIRSGETLGITFQNQIREDSIMSYFRYMYLYNSGGSAVGDLDNDGLPDLFFTSMRNSCRLYKNLGDLQFEDVTASAGMQMGDVWATGATMVDINGDGLLDIYVCLSGPDHDRNALRNRLYINLGGMRFEERAAAFGLDDNGNSQMAYFYDLDGDEDLDLYLVSTRTDFHNNKNVDHLVLIKPTSPYTDRIYLNDGKGGFKDHSGEAGILNHAWGLAAAIGDMTGNGRPDIYVSNDFTEPDIFYANKGNATFRNETLNAFRHICLFAMGSDLADFNNDGLADLFVVDMTPPDHFSSKTNMASMRPKSFQMMVDVGWHHQYMTNMLQMNNGNGTFSEIAHVAGVDRTDWSWAPFFLDLDNDGWKDLFVGNGVWRETGNNDAKVALDRMKKSMGSRIDFDEAIGLFPLGHAQNEVFRNTGDLRFERVMKEWGYEHQSVTTGATYADLDLDGDLDIVTNNVNAPVTIIENRSRNDHGSHYLQVQLRSEGPNTNAIGSRVVLRSASGPQYVEVTLARGFQSGVEAVAHFGVKDPIIDSLEVHWPDGTWTLMTQVERDQRLTIVRERSERREPIRDRIQPLLADRTIELAEGFVHRENSYDDFRKEILLPHRQSDQSPRVSVGDVNDDGLEDLFIGAAVGHAPKLAVQSTSGNFSQLKGGPWEQHIDQEIVGQHFFDADGDGDLDLYLAAGSTEFGTTGPRYQDRLYLNNGKGRFTEATEQLPSMPTPTQIVVSADVDQDGDLDLFVGGRNVPDAYPAHPKSYLLINDGGAFVDVVQGQAPELEHAGMITDAVFADIDQDGDKDLLVCGEWMAIRCFLNQDGRFSDATATLLDPTLTGWWYDLTVADLDGDGDLDIVSGNLGLNNKFRPSREKPLEIYMADLDATGTNDIVLAKHQDSSRCVPVRGRECSSEQMPFIQEKFGTYKAFANADLDLLYGKENLTKALHLSATTMESMVWWNRNGRFEPAPLPVQAQIAPIRGCVVLDVNEDGIQDLIVAGNLYGSEVETTRYDAGNGLVLLGSKQGRFEPLSIQRSGLFAPDDVRDVQLVHIGRNATPAVFISSNNGPCRIFLPNRGRGGDRLAMGR